MKEIIFNSKEEFAAWHDAVKLEKGYPQVNFNAATGLPAPDKQQTVAFVNYIEHPTKSDNRVVCVVDDMKLSANLKKAVTLKAKGEAKKLGWVDEVAP